MNFVFSNRAKLFTYVLMAVGLISLVLGIVFYDGHHYGRVWTNLLINGFYFLAISLGALFFYALHFATETSWAVILRRVIEGVFSFLPWATVVLIIVFIASSFHWNHIYHWMDPETMDPDSVHFDPIIAGKSAYLNLPFFWIRTILYFVAFIMFARFFRKRSLQEDEVGGTKLHMLGYKRGALFLVIFAVFSSTLVWDWIMSIDVHWFSTLFGWYVFSGMWVAGMNVISILTLFLISKGYLQNVNSSHIQDVGKWVFALSFLWSYLWFSQFLLIWYSNIPEEVTYFITRIENYKILFFGMFIINFLVPMVGLMSRDAKRNPKFLITIGTIIFIGHYLDTYMLVTPGVFGGEGDFGFFEIGMLIGFTGLFINRVLQTLSQAPLVPKHSPYLEESLHHSI